MKIAVILPCYNESETIANTVSAFRKSLPEAEIVVCDNASTDSTAIEAARAGARVINEQRKGKGNAVKRLFSVVDADVYVMADGDQTYDASAAPMLIQHLVKGHHDMVIGAREHVSDKAYRPGHQFGNKAITSTVNWLFGSKGQVFKDVLSGYRIMSRRFVQSLPIEAKGFDIETELNVHSLELGLSVDEVMTEYYERPTGSDSKLNTYQDGFKILMRILMLIKDCKPFTMFGIASIAFMLSALAVSGPVFYQYFTTGIIPSIPSAILAAGLGVCSVLSLIGGVVLDGVARVYRRQKVMMYLQHPKSERKYSKEPKDMSYAA